MDSEQILFDFAGKNICRSRIFGWQKFCGPPEGRSLRNARSVNGTQKQNAFSGASARFRVPSASFLPILFWQDRKEWAAGGTTRHSGAEKIWPAERRRRRRISHRPFGAYETCRRKHPAPFRRRKTSAEAEEIGREGQNLHNLQKSTLDNDRKIRMIILSHNRSTGRRGKNRPV